MPSDRSRVMRADVVFQYINTRLTRSHEASIPIRQPLTPLLTSHIYPLFPPSEINDYSLSPHLFVRNTEEGEKALVDRTVEAYEEVIVSYDDNGEWRPSYLPHAKPLQEIMHAMHKYVHSVASSSRRLRRAFPETKENGDGVAAAAWQEDRVKDEEKSARSERKSSSRRREESRATKAVLAFFGAEASPASTDKTTAVVAGEAVGTMATMAAIQVEVVEGGADVPVGRAARSRSRSVSVRREVNGKTVEQKPSETTTHERTDISTVRPTSVVPQSDDPFTAPLPKRKRMSMPGYDIIQRRIRERSRMLSETPAPEHDDPVSGRRSGSIVPDFPARARRASMGPQARERTPAPTVEREAEVGSVWVPSPGMRFQMDTEGRLVYIGMADALPLGMRTGTGAGEGSVAVKTPGDAMRSLRKVKEAAAATRFGQTTPTGGQYQHASPAARSSRRGFVKPLVPGGAVRSVKVEDDGVIAQDAQREGARDPVGRMLDVDADREVDDGSTQSMPPLSRIPQASASSSRIPVRTIGTPGHADPKLQNPTETRRDNPSSTSNRYPAFTGAINHLRKTSTPSTTTNNPTSRKRPAPFDDSTIQRVPPSYRAPAAELRMSSSSMGAAAFSKAQRERSRRR